MSQQQYVKEQTGKKPVELFNQDDRQQQELINILKSLNVKYFKNIYNNSRDFLNSALFSSGEHKGFVLKIQDYISGIPGTQVTANQNFSTSQNIISSIHFSGDVTLAATANVIYDKCRFDNQVVISSGGKANFIGCIFYSNVTNAGALGDVNIVGCLRQSATAHVNCTIICENTF